MRLVQTAFLPAGRIQDLVEGEYPSFSYTPDGRLVLARRKPLPTDWVNGVFVGDHDEPEDENEPHVHGEPVA